jgi:UDP-N-acetylmuramate dehydrogenase
MSISLVNACWIKLVQDSNISGYQDTSGEALMGVDVRGLAQILGPGIMLNTRLATYAGVGVGGPADVLYLARSRDELLAFVTQAHALGIRWRVYGGLTNVLVPDSGLRGLVILNYMRGYTFTEDYKFTAESGVNVVKVAREAVQKGFGGLTWAVGLPGTIGGAIVNNAGAFGGAISKRLTHTEVYIPGDGVHIVDNSWFEFNYRYSKLKARTSQALVIESHFQLKQRDKDILIDKAEEYTQRRRNTQPAGKTLGSTFKNPEGDYAGRLIEAAGLKGTRSGGFMISEKHANFFINTGEGKAADYRALVQLAQDEVNRQFGIQLEPEIEILAEEPATLDS